MIPFNKPLDVSDFSDVDFMAILREIYPHEMDRFGPEWPVGHEYRKDWEVGMAVMALKSGGAIRPDAQILGVGAGNEPTIFYLTNLVRSVHATDLYLSAATDQPKPKRLPQRLGEFADASVNVVRPSDKQPMQINRRLRKVARAAVNVLKPTTAHSALWAESANVNMFLDPGRYWPQPWNPRRMVVQHMNGLDLHYEDETFDGIFSSGSIEHFGGYPEVRKAAQEMARVLKPGGVLTVSTEYRLDGPGPGLPGILMFTEAELMEHIVEPSGLELMGAFVTTISTAVLGAAIDFAWAGWIVREHVAEHGEVFFHKLTWPLYPAVALTYEGRTWTSCHLALRKKN